MASHSFDLFSRADKPAREKVILLGSVDHLSLEIMDRVRSLHIEHVSPAILMRRGISRPRRFGNRAELADLALLRHWFWTRKPDAGFLLTDFPATLLQAKVFDEWLEARNESLDAVVATSQSADAVLEYYREYGLLFEQPNNHSSLQ